MYAREIIIIILSGKPCRAVSVTERPEQSVNIYFANLLSPHNHIYNQSIANVKVPV